MKRDVESLDDIKILVQTFYEKVKADDTIGYFFNNVAKVNWEQHLPVMYAFWQQVVFHEGDYKGNPMMPHQQLHQRSPFHKQHFERWQQLFFNTVDDLFEGENATVIKQRAKSIAMVMQLKILHNGVGLGNK